MGAKKIPIRRRAYAKVAADGTGSVLSRRVDQSEMECYQSIAFRNRTGARGTLEVYLKSGEEEFFIFDQLSPGANTWYWYPYPQTLKQGERLIAKQESCSADDQLDLHCIGYMIYGSNGEIP